MSETTPAIEPIPDYGDLIPLRQWRDRCRNGLFIDYDGTGYFATATGMSDLPARPSRHEEHCPTWATHVMWFNR